MATIGSLAVSIGMDSRKFQRDAQKVARTFKNIGAQAKQAAKTVRDFAKKIGSIEIGRDAFGAGLKKFVDFIKEGVKDFEKMKKEAAEVGQSLEKFTGGIITAEDIRAMEMFQEQSKDFAVELRAFRIKVAAAFLPTISNALRDIAPHLKTIAASMSKTQKTAAKAGEAFGNAIVPTGPESRLSHGIRRALLKPEFVGPRQQTVPAGTRSITQEAREGRTPGQLEQAQLNEMKRQTMILQQMISENVLQMGF